MAKVKQQELPRDEKLEQALVPEDEQPYEVPSNWVWTYFSNVCSFENGYAFKSDDYQESGIPLIRISNICEGEIDISKCVYIQNENLDERFVISKGDLLIAMSGATTGKNGVYQLDTPAYLNQRVGNIKIKNQNVVYNKFRDYYIYNKNQEILNKAYGGAQPNISSTKIGEMLFPLPPIAEQQRIVGRIESLFEKLDNAKKLAQNALDTFETRKAAILHKAFTGELTAKWREKNGLDFEQDWEERKFSELGELERGRSQHRPRNAPELFGGDYPFIQTGDVANANVYIVEHKQTLSEFGLKQSRLFPKGTLCITIAANIGDVAILSYDCCFPDSVVGFTPNSLADSKFIYYFMNIMKAEIEHYAPATAQKNINLKILNDILVKTPPIEEQREIVLRLDKLFQMEQQAKELCDIIEKIDLIKKAILARAFRGELGTNDPSEESALELLKECLL